MESDEPVLFSKFGLKGKKDRHLRYVLRRIGVTGAHDCDYDEDSMAFIWLTDATLEHWHALSHDVRRRLAWDFLDTLHRRTGGFDDLFEFMFIFASRRNRKLAAEASAVAADVLRSGMEQSFRKDGELREVLDFSLRKMPYMEAVVIPKVERMHVRTRSRGCLCPCAKRPLYLAFYCALPEVVRLLLSLGARLYLDDVCRCRRGTARHPLDALFGRVSAARDDTRRQWDVLSLQLLLVDAPASFRHTIRRRFGYLGDVIEKIPSLQHMARASIRQQLRDSRRMGERDALERCGLPKRLQSYINMDDVVTGV